MTGHCGLPGEAKYETEDYFTNILQKRKYFTGSESGLSIATSGYTSNTQGSTGVGRVAFRDMKLHRPQHIFDLVRGHTSSIYLYLDVRWGGRPYNVSSFLHYSIGAGEKI